MTLHKLANVTSVSQVQNVLEARTVAEVRFPSEPRAPPARPCRASTGYPTPPTCPPAAARPPGKHATAFRARLDKESRSSTSCAHTTLTHRVRARAASHPTRPPQPASCSPAPPVSWSRGQLPLVAAAAAAAALLLAPGIDLKASMGVSMKGSSGARRASRRQRRRSPRRRRRPL